MGGPAASYDAGPGLSSTTAGTHSIVVAWRLVASTTHARLQATMPISKPNIRFLLASLLVAVVACLLFVPGLPGEFVFDDFHNIVNNPAVHLTQFNAHALGNVLANSQVSGVRPLPMLSFALDYWRAGGADPLVFKTTNLAIHALTAFALAWLFRSLLLASGIRDEQARWLAPALALAWAAHPVQVSSVLYTVQRIQTMGTLFLVLALLGYLQARRAQIAGFSGRTGLLASALLWAMALGCKEDSTLLPAYTLALELTVLRFAAADTRVTTHLKHAYLLATLMGAAIYLLWVVPHYWQWEALAGRDFSTPERLLTQPRVLCTYLWQILVPLPQHMPFYYDWLQPSRNLLQPWTTLPAIGIVMALLLAAWRSRVHMPLFALGVFLFFASHFIASNVVALELAFEHRNHFALIGAVLAVGSLLAQAGKRLALRPAAMGIVCVALLVGLAGATMMRAKVWSSTSGIAAVGTQAAPASGRAWVQLCSSQFKAGGGAVAGNPKLDEAIETCSKGAVAAPQSLNSLTLLMVLKSLRGDAAPQDWDRLQQRMRRVYMSDDNTRVFLILVAHARMGVKLDRQDLVETLDILLERGNFGPVNRANLGLFVLNDLQDPDRALPYFIKSIEARAPGDPFALQLAADLRARGRPDLAERIERLGMPPSRPPVFDPDGAD